MKEGVQKIISKKIKRYCTKCDAILTDDEGTICIKCIEKAINKVVGNEK